MEKLQKVAPSGVLLHTIDVQQQMGGVRGELRIDICRCPLHDRCL
jgi:hypothetical protein